MTTLTELADNATAELFIQGIATKEELQQVNTIILNALKQVITHSAAALGSIKSEKKAAAARENGKKGGRPRKTPLTT